MKLKRIQHACILVAVFAVTFLTVAGVTAQQSAPSPYDLIAAVNSLRAQFGVGGLSANAALMNAAQAHSAYQAAIGTWSHTGSGGTDETARAIAAGYGSGGSVSCDEAVAVGNLNNTVNDIVFSFWSDYTHRDLVLTNNRYVDIGAGVVEKNGLVYYTVDVCVSGSSSINQPDQSASTPAAPLNAATVDLTQQIVGVITSTPGDDGAVYHVVQPGQAPWSIANAYGLTIARLAEMNNLSTDNPVLFPDQKLVIMPSFTPSMTPTITNTPPAPTRTMAPTSTPRPPTVTPTPQPTATLTPRSLLPDLPDLDSMNLRLAGYILIGICVVGLAAVLITTFRSR